MRSRQDYLDTLRFVEGYKGQYGYQLMGWKSVIDSIEILFDSRVVRVRYHTISGDTSNYEAAVSSKAYATKGPYELIYSYYTSLVPDGFSVWFEHDGSREIINSYNELRAEIDRHNNMWKNPGKY